MTLAVVCMLDMAIASCHVCQVLVSFKVVVTGVCRSSCNGVPLLIVAGICGLLIGGACL